MDGEIRARECRRGSRGRGGRVGYVAVVSEITTPRRPITDEWASVHHCHGSGQTRPAAGQSGRSSGDQSPDSIACCVGLPRCSMSAATSSMRGGLHMAAVRNAEGWSRSGDEGLKTSSEPRTAAAYLAADP